MLKVLLVCALLFTCTFTCRRRRRTENIKLLLRGCKLEIDARDRENYSTFFLLLPKLTAKKCTTHTNKRSTWKKFDLNERRKKVIWIKKNRARVVANWNAATCLKCATARCQLLYAPVRIYKASELPINLCVAIVVNSERCPKSLRFLCCVDNKHRQLCTPRHCATFCMSHSFARSLGVDFISLSLSAWCVHHRSSANERRLPVCVCVLIKGTYAWRQHIHKWCGRECEQRSQNDQSIRSMSLRLNSLVRSISFWAKKRQTFATCRHLWHIARFHIFSVVAYLRVYLCAHTGNWLAARVSAWQHQ